ncbi:TetR/AcrR family transcriptional regulator [Chungangia koreensis]|uniref:TetR/AcrR family transcriptional regulator n=1 Tax=Chungangia koreensis TaxID=752657 RepID=A0ABV8X223_9LACT
MTQNKTDLRVIRTRKLIMDSFIELSGRKEFKDITVKDLTEEAMVNRATFYYHFQDIYDLLEKALSEVLSINLNCDSYENNGFNEKTFVGIFNAITDFQKSLSTRCHRGYEETIARIIKDQLEVIFYRLLRKERPTEDELGQKTMAAMLSWGMYGASVEWRRHSKEFSPEEYIKLVFPYISKGINNSI